MNEEVLKNNQVELFYTKVPSQSVQNYISAEVEKVLRKEKLAEFRAFMESALAEDVANSRHENELFIDGAISATDTPTADHTLSVARNSVIDESAFQSPSPTATSGPENIFPRAIRD